MPEAGVFEFLAWVLQKRRRFRVSGWSMYPTLKEGDDVFVDPQAFRSSPPQVGDVVVARHPLVKDTWTIKRIQHRSETGEVELRGDEPIESGDSRGFGMVPESSLLGRVTSRWRSHAN